mmetsp:Transcript_8349/g.25249  ORF Transcript_8349/g.25249 Transcript_8349/m.25249 type:complete len:86 (-) Transcript_8349:99-356(-)
MAAVAEAEPREDNARGAGCEAAAATAHGAATTVGSGAATPGRGTAQPPQPRSSAPPAGTVTQGSMSTVALSLWLCIRCREEMAAR